MILDIFKKLAISKGFVLKAGNLLMGSRMITKVNPSRWLGPRSVTNIKNN